MAPNEEPSSGMVWQILQFSDALDFEFASALAELVPVVLWEPARRLFPAGHSFHESERTGESSFLRIRTFPLQRGYARFPLSALVGTGPALAARLARAVPAAERSVLVCTTPFFAPVAECWPGPVVYWISDLIAAYRVESYRRVRALDRRMCRVASLVCPNSERIAGYLRTEADCAADRIAVLPNATGRRSILPEPSLRPLDLPAPYTDLPRPLAGVIGNLAENTDWIFLERLLALTPWLYWLFVGPIGMPMRKAAQRRARHRVMQHGRTHFAAARPYNELHQFARGVDVAVLPYSLREPTYSGSSTRFYDHLAACHPILATAAVDELERKEPFLRLVHSPEDAAAALEALRSSGFQDGLREARWLSSRQNTWRDRAMAMRDALTQRLAYAGVLPPGSNFRDTADDNVTDVR